MAVGLECVHECRGGKYWVIGSICDVRENGSHSVEVTLVFWAQAAQPGAGDRIERMYIL